MGWPQPLSTLSEDCLTLNVFTGPPTTARGRAAAPVLFWIYGGGFQGGGGNETRLNGTWDAALLAGELVVVTSNYRLGVFGFAASEALAERERRTEDGCGRTNCSTGNYGILDQRAALRWVQKNIAAFGGDPKRVMIVGQSAGASSVSQHLVRRESWGLFSSAGMESGAFYDGLDGPSVASQAALWGTLAASLKCDKAGTAIAIADCLVRVDPVELLQASWRGGADGAWVPTVDGVELSAPGPELARRGLLAQVPVFAGSVAEDLSVLEPVDCSPSNCSEDGFMASAAAAGYDRPSARELLRLYMRDAPRPGTKSDSPYFWAFRHLGADSWAGCPARRVARWYADAGLPSFWYRWSYVPAGPNGGGLAHHAVEQPFIFHVVSETDEELREDKGMYHLASAEEVALSAQLVRSWAAMAASGNPATSEVPWRPFNSTQNGTALLLEGGAGEPALFAVAHNFMSTKCAIIDSVFWKKQNATHRYSN